MKSPCMNCEKRFVGCHSSCEEYISFRGERDKINAVRLAENKRYGEYVESLKRTKKKYKK